MNNEEFVDINGYGGRYQVNILGVVRVVRKDKLKRKGEWRYLKGTLSHGYIIYSLNNKDRHYQHRLIMEYFIPNPENKPCVNHINSIRSDNRVENLEWVTHRENTIHAKKLGRLTDFNLLNSKRKKQILDLETGIFYDCLSDFCDVFKLNISTERVKFCQGKQKRILYTGLTGVAHE